MKELVVSLNHFGLSCTVGILAKKEHKVYFEYDKNFLESGIRISPYSIPLQSGLKEFNNISFSDIFGGFADSLPDGWGLLLLDRYLKQNNLPYKGLTSFERLSFTGKTAMGALEYSPANLFDNNQEAIDLLQMSQNAIAIYEGDSDYVISKLAKAGGSPGGARPKIVMTEKEDGIFVTDSGVYEDNDNHWLIKFDVSKEFKDFSSVEFLYSLLAKRCGIEMSETKLFKDSKENNYFGTLRFDRLGAYKIHSHTFGSLVESNFRIPCQDYKELMLVCFDLTKNINDVYKVFRLMVFNHLVSNQDDHVKNFSFVMNSDYEWKFAPAYDLTPCFGMNNWHSMTINGKGINISEQDYILATDGVGLDKKKCFEIIEEVKEGVASIDIFSDVVMKSDLKRIKVDYLL